MMKKQKQEQSFYEILQCQICSFPTAESLHGFLVLALWITVGESCSAVCSSLKQDQSGAINFDAVQHFQKRQQIFPLLTAEFQNVGKVIPKIV